MLLAIASRLAAEHLLRRDLRLLPRHAGADLVALDARADTTVFVTVLAARGAGAVTTTGAVRAREGAWSTPQDPARPTTAHIRFDTIRVTVDADDSLLRLEHLEGAPRIRSVRGPAAGMPATGRTSGAEARRRS